MLDASFIGTPETFDLEAVVRELRGDVAYRKNGHLARTLVRGEDLRLVAVVMRSGSRLREHCVDDTACVHALSGRIRVRHPNGAVHLAAGQVLVMARGLRHEVEADEDSAFVLALGWRGEQRPPNPQEQA